TLYEGGTLRDIHQRLEINSGSATNNEMVQKLISASREPDAGKRMRALDAVLDMDRFLSMMAMETILCHSDTYSMNRNNYRIYHDPTTDKLVFMPHGMDRVLGTHRSPLDLSIVPTMLGMAARGILSTPEGRRRHVERVGILFTNHFDPDQLCARVREMDAKIIGFKTNELATRPFETRPDHRPERDADDLCSRISERALAVKFQLSDVQELIVPPPVPEFGTNKIALLSGWKPKRPVIQSASCCEATVENDLLHLHSTSTPLLASLRTRITLPLGNYRIAGENIVTNSAGVTNLITLTLVRYSSNRFAIDKQFGEGRSINLPFQVNPALAPEEIELVCDIRENGSDVWFDPRALKLIKLEVPFTSP
ncbi:MAG TPA: CotH kinase family protein, partial [Verrucomicrobiae bacterium]